MRAVRAEGEGVGEVAAVAARIANLAGLDRYMEVRGAVD